MKAELTADFADDRDKKILIRAIRVIRDKIPSYQRWTLSRAFLFTSATAFASIFTTARS